MTRTAAAPQDAGVPIVFGASGQRNARVIVDTHKAAAATMDGIGFRKERCGEEKRSIARRNGVSRRNGV